MQPGPRPREGMTARLREALHQYRKVKTLQAQLNSAQSKLEQVVMSLGPTEKSQYERDIKTIG